MKTQTASGRSSHSDAALAAREAVRQAKEALAGPPTVGFVFAAARYDFDALLAGARAEAPGCALLAAQTAGEFTERGPTAGGVAVLLTTLPPHTFCVASATGLGVDPLAAGRALTADFRDLSQRARTWGAALSTTVMLTDGLSGQGEKVVREVLNSTRLFQQIVGGAAGDDGAFASTQVGTHQFAGRDAAVALHVFGKTGWGVGAAHGLQPRSKVMTVTRAQGTVLYELDGRPAFDVYRDYAATRGVQLEPATAGAFLIAHELGVFFLNELHHARAAIRVGSAGELHLVAEVIRGAQVCILDGEPQQMLAACRHAAERARANLGTAPAAGVLVFDCVCRGQLLGARFRDEVAAIAEVFPGTPIAGFLTYGEIARYRGALDGWHNTTAVVVAIPAEEQNA